MSLNRHQLLNEILSQRAFERGDGIATHFPRDIYLQVASACNLDCFMCSEHNRPADLRRGHGLTSFSPDLFRVLEEEIFPYSQVLMIGVGGEPTLSPHLQEYIERAHAMNQEVQLLTNGTRIRTDAMARTIARCVSHLQVSVDAATPEIYEKIRSGSRWKSLQANMDRLNRFRLAEPPARRTFLQLNMVLMQCNIHELPALVAYAKKLDADRLYGQHLIIVTEDARSESLFDRPDLYNRVYEEAMACAKDLGVDLDLPDPYSDSTPPECGMGTPDVKMRGEAGEEILIPCPVAKSDRLSGRRSSGKPALPCSRADFDPPVKPAPVDRIPCHMPTKSILILYDGRVFPCCHPYAHKQMEIGDLNRQSFKEIWNHRQYRNLRAGLARGDAPHICRSCSLVHNPPPEREDPDLLSREGNSLEAHYGDRDLAPMQEVAGECIDALSATSLLDSPSRAQERVEAMQASLECLEKERDNQYTHILNLEKEQKQLTRHISNLEEEKAVLLDHIRHLDKGLARYRDFPAVKLARRIRSLFLDREQSGESS